MREKYLNLESKSKRFLLEVKIELELLYQITTCEFRNKISQTTNFMVSDYRVLVLAIKVNHCIYFWLAHNNLQVFESLLSETSPFVPRYNLLVQQ